MTPAQEKRMKELAAQNTFPEGHELHNYGIDKYMEGYQAAMSDAQVLVDALEYYGDPDSWLKRTSGHGESSKDVISGDGGYFDQAGKLARQALSQFRGDK